MTTVNNIYLGDCLDVMKDIPDGSIDLILTDYNNGLSLRKIADKFHTNHHRIKMILVSNGVCIRKPKHTRGLRKYDNVAQRNYANMCSHLRFNVDLNWIMQFDYEKLKILNNAITNRDGRWNMETKDYIEYIEHFHNDSQFITVFNKYIKNPCKYTKPSIDHIIPKSCGGTSEISNLQFLSWFENRCKNDMSQSEWNNLKSNIKEYLI